MLTRLAILGHELQHAAEIADSADAVDDQSVEQLYQRIGFQMSESARQFDTAAARQMGERVLEELRSRPERQIAAR
jgi:hypothetical protein